MVIRPYESPPVWLRPSCLAIPDNELAGNRLARRRENLGSRLRGNDKAGPVWWCEFLRAFIFLDNKQASRNVYYKSAADAAATMRGGRDPEGLTWAGK